MSIYIVTHAEEVVYMSDLAIFIALGTALGLMIYVFLRTRIFQQTILLRELEERLRRKLTKDEQKISDIKRDAITRMGPKTFYYLDATQVNDLYIQVVQEPEAKEIETEESQSTGKGIKGVLLWAEPKYEKVKSLKIKKRYAREVTPVTMYNRVEEYLLSKGDVSFAIEDFEYDDSSLHEFYSMCSQMKDNFDFTIPDELQKNFISDKTRGFALNAVEGISKTSGYIAVQAEFMISPPTTDCNILDFKHPVNEYLNADDIEIHLQIACDSNSLTPAGKTTFTMGNSAKITAIGKVVRWDSVCGTLVINPIAIY